MILKKIRNTLRCENVFFNDRPDFATNMSTLQQINVHMIEDAPLAGGQVVQVKAQGSKDSHQFFRLFLKRHVDARFVNPSGISEIVRQLDSMEQRHFS